MECARTTATNKRGRNCSHISDFDGIANRKRQKITNIPLATKGWWKFGSLAKEVIPESYLSNLTQKPEISSSPVDTSENSDAQHNILQSSSLFSKERASNFSTMMPRQVTEENLRVSDGGSQSSERRESMQNSRFLHSLFPTVGIRSKTFPGVSPTAAFLKVGKRDYISYPVESGEHQQVPGRSPLMSFLVQHQRYHAIHSDQSQGTASAPQNQAQGMMTSMQNRTCEGDDIKEDLQQGSAFSLPNTRLYQQSDEDDRSFYTDSTSDVKFRAYQAENWTEKFEELLEFRKENGHCLVPNLYPENPSLAQWTKRQRYQFKLRQNGQRSTITDERIRALDQVGFIWDSHAAIWSERLEELKQFREVFGHCNVPSRYEPNHQLAIWVKRQRRQYKNKLENKQHCMTDERQAALESIGFVWDMKKHSSK
mmetsp:Transcript_4918/g.9143  ORF Transcript_4918/g.9143 Transcript_4918/m.9143 type:complete len:425 (-) Transcript_4918:289-1563(-)|eukprot:CAMPEP_0178738674 /NCGR_PEP_ID=MMETSP0744-20121128/3640_1 /TAXON_ID=913974 /ORGANISM="Nitzschia punctata, Strain CCMP561" /LENGTH=424 /DNA_ID=CAMNT_0020391311 /DNA_START=15 /DNA_END=1289 /DNA_ORIENTATION=-